MDAKEIRRWHSVFKRDDELFEIRILGDRTWSGYFYDVEVAIKELEHFGDCNTYYTINEVKKACASREQFNCFKQVKGTATSKTDIEHRWWIAVDVDCERPSGVASTDNEKEKAHKKAQEVYAFLRDNGFSMPVVCDSSSGYHLLYPIDMDNDQASEDTIKAFLEVLSNKFTDEDVKIDRALIDSNRILRLSGSIGCKGRNSAERPHRLAKILSTPNEIVRMNREQIDVFNAKYAIKVEQTQRRQFNGISNEQFNLRDFIEKYDIRIAKEIPISGGGTKYILEECPFDSQHKAPDSALFELPNGSVAFKCFHNSCSQYDWRAFRLHFEPHAYDYENQQGQHNQTQQYAHRQYTPQKPKYEIKGEIPELGKKWLTMSSIKKVDLSKIDGVKTGVVELDRSIVKLHYGEVTVLSGGNASGKSSFLNTLILNIANQGVPSALWSGELPEPILKAWIQMVAAGKNNLRMSQFGDGKFFVPQNIGDQIDKWLDNLLFIYNTEYGNQWEQLLADMEVMYNAGIKVFILDNLMAMNIDLLEGDKNNKQKTVILKVKEFAKKKNVHVILVAHPRKSMAFLRKNDISGTADLTNAVDNIFIMHRVNNDFLRQGEEFFGKGNMKQFDGFGNVLEVCKNRMYGIVDLFVGMHYELESRRFKNTIDENVKYGWELPPQQITFNYQEDRCANYEGDEPDNQELDPLGLPITGDPPF